MAERIGEKTGWQFIQHVVDIVVIPLGTFGVWVIWTMSQSLVQLQTNVNYLSSQVGVLVSQSTYDATQFSVDERLDRMEKDLDKLEAEMRSK